MYLMIFIIGITAVINIFTDVMHIFKGDFLVIHQY